MKIQISTKANYDAGLYITQKLLLHKNEPTLLLLSGGSAFSVFDSISADCLTQQTVVAFVDDRFTTDRRGNTFTQFEETQLYANACLQNATFINSKPQKGEGHQDFCSRIQDEFERIFKNTPTLYTLGLFGIGEDGHTASLFPSTENEFEATYILDSLYVPVYKDTTPYPYRGTITPQFIEEKIDDVVLFAIGSNKCDNILNYMHNKNFAQHQIPALIPAQHPNSILFTDCATLV